jgi:hypothetical protein
MSEDFIRRVMAAWYRGYDTAMMATAFNVPESDCYRALIIGRDAMKAGRA